MRVDRRDLQGNVLRGYRFDTAGYLFLSVADAAAGRSLLAGLVDEVTTDEPWPGRTRPPTALNVAVTAAGLAALGVAERTVGRFPRAFRQGMAARATLLGDVGASAPERWEPELRGGDAHLLVSVHADTPEAVDERVRDLRGRVEGAPGLGMVYDQRAALLPFGREHFGFSDGFAQPTVEPGGTERPLAVGEFVHGYEDEDGLLPSEPGGPIARNGTFMVWRKLHQDVALFRSFTREAGRLFPGGEEEAAAKIVGRWRDGSPLVLAPDRPRPEREGDRVWLNRFTYADDPHGHRCPLGAHIRRANPRDALGWGDKLSARHRLLRRGMPYGEPLPPDAPGDDGHERGLVFVCLQASIERQFEVVQAQWCNDGNPFGLGADRDFLVGDPTFGSNKMTVQGRPPRFLSPQPLFTVTRGGEYLFAPGVAALRAIAAGLPE